MAVRHVLGDGNDDWSGRDYDFARSFLFSATQDHYEIIDAGGGNDTVNGFGGGDTIDGGSGDDSLLGGEGEDSLVGGTGHDTLSGGIDNDTLAGGKGNDRLSGDAGRDLIDGGEGQDLLLGGADADTLSGGAGDDRLEGGAGDDVLHAGGNPAAQGGAGVDVLLGGDGADRLFSGFFGDTAAGDRLYGGTGTDTATISLENAASGVTFLRGVFDGGAELRGTNDMRIALDIENLSITGSAFDDGLLGGDGADALAGGGGNDRLAGGAGRDVLTGGAGQDIFVFSRIADTARATADVVTDFESGIVSFTGFRGDRIDLSGIDARASTAANEAFDFIGEMVFLGREGQLRIAYGSNTTRIEGDADGDRAADFAIELTGLHTLRMDGGFANFIL